MANIVIEVLVNEQIKMCLLVSAHFYSVLFINQISKSLSLEQKNHPISSQDITTYRKTKYTVSPTLYNFNKLTNLINESPILFTEI